MQINKFIGEPEKFLESRKQFKTAIDKFKYNRCRKIQIF